MSLKVYFDNTLIDEQYYTGLTNNNELFSDSFRLGTTPCNQFTLKIAKEGVNTQPSIIQLYDDLVPFANLKVDNIEEQDYEYVYTLTDRMVDLNFYYDASEIFENGSTTLYKIALDICTKVGLNLGTIDFRGYDKVITWYDNTRTARDYIGFIAELNGGFARIENNILYFRKQKTNSQTTIQIDDCEDFTIGESHKITRVVYELGALKYEFGDETGNTLYLNSDNVYITSESEVEAIYNDIKDFEFYSYTTKNCPIDYNIKAGDIITFTDGMNDYATIAQYDLEYFGNWYGGYSLDINTERQEETQIVGDKQNIKNLRIIVDRNTNTVQQVVEEVGEQNQKISQVTQTVNELNSKISDIADITTQQETIYGSLNFTDINQSEPIEIRIHPTTTNISYLYPRANLYPSDILYLPDRRIKFTNTETNEVLYYTLPDDLLISQNGVYDEFYLEYDQQVCQVTKRCGYNADGTVYELAQEEIHTYTPYPSIPLTDGDYTIELLGYNNAYMSIRLMAQNIYTTQFAIKAEMNSEFIQTERSFNLKLEEKLDGEDFTGANILLEINNDQSSAQINADKIDLNGVVTANNNFRILRDGSMQAKNGTFTGGEIALVGGDRDNPKISVKDPSDSSVQTFLAPKQFSVGGYAKAKRIYFNDGYFMAGDLNNAFMEINYSSTYPFIVHANDAWFTQCTIHARAYNYDSLQSLKKNIKPYNKNALDILKNSEIYEFNFKNENDNEKKHIGFVIPDEGGNFKTPNEVLEKNKKGIDAYNMVSILWKAVQEQQQKIEELEKRLEEK